MSTAFVVKYIRGGDNIADSLSRLIPHKNNTPSDGENDEYVKFVAKSAVPKALTIQDIEAKSAEDSALSQLRDSLAHGGV